MRYNCSNSVALSLLLLAISCCFSYSYSYSYSNSYSHIRCCSHSHRYSNRYQFSKSKILFSSNSNANTISTNNILSSENSSSNSISDSNSNSKRNIIETYFYNTLTRKKELFIPLQAPKVSFYSCGPTVYDYAHIGNFRAFLTYDLVKRWLSYCGYDVEHICNLTDVDDKIIIKLSNEKKSLKDVTDKYANAFFDDLEMLNIVKAKKYPRATEHIDDIKDMVQRLVDIGSAYLEKGSVYFRVSSSKNYGELANLKFDEMEEGAGGFGPNERRGTDEKENSRDFALWKAFTPQDGEVVWNSKFGRGRPGWHIECSAMCNRLLGSTIDIHAGGVDLVFPHHQNEIAQSEAYSGKQFSRYWIHNGFVNIDNEKMSKSLKNFKTLRDIVEQPIDARAFRFMVISSQYRNPLNFNAETLQAAKNSLKRIDKVIESLKTISGDDETNAKYDDVIQEATIEFEKAMSDDLNSPKGNAALFKLVNAAEKAIKINSVDKCTAEKFLNAFENMDRVYGILYEVPEKYLTKKTSTSDAVNSKDYEVAYQLGEKRKERKAAKDYGAADSLRDQIIALGYGIKDTKDGFDLFLMNSNY